MPLLQQHEGVREVASRNLQHVQVEVEDEQEVPTNRPSALRRTDRDASEGHDDDASSGAEDSDGDGEDLPPLQHRNPFARLRGFNFVFMIVIDAMHTIGGVMKDLFRCIQGLREAANVAAYEAQVNSRDFGDVHRACKWWGVDGDRVGKVDRHAWVVAIYRGLLTSFVCSWPQLMMIYRRLCASLKLWPTTCQATKQAAGSSACLTATRPLGPTTILC